MTIEEIATALCKAFPNETVYAGQRLSKRQAELINMLMLKMKIHAATWTLE